MRPQDIVILLKIIALESSDWQLKDLASSLYISPSEISESLNRSAIAGLIDHNKHRINRQAFFEFLVHGIRYVFPQQPGYMTNGIPTAHSHEYLRKKIVSDQYYVWPDPLGKERGVAVDPLYGKQVEAVKNDAQLYKLLALVDVLRIGRVREIKLAVAELERIMLYVGPDKHNED